MPTMKTSISWTDSTWNPTTGCHKVSNGCLNCYAEAMTKRFGGDFDTILLHANRLAQVNRFKPLVQEDGSLLPRMVFVNSMSDIFHDEIPDSFRHEVFDAIDQHPDTIFQALTKRAMTMRRFITERYKGDGVPDHLWLGVSAEDNLVRGRIDTLRRLKGDVGNFTAFLSVEPLIGPVDRHDYSDMDWVLIGGESGTKARPCHVDWVRQARDEARRHGAAIWFKQWGNPKNNPLVIERMERDGTGVRAAWERVVASGLEREPEEKGGATLDGLVLHDLPPAYTFLSHKLNTLPDEPRL